MRTSHLALATVLAAAALSVQAGPRMETANSPFTYEAVGATPVLTFGRAPRTKAAEAPKAIEAPKAAASKSSPPAAASGTAFTYDALGATPHVELKKQAAQREAQLPPAAH